MKKNLLVLVVVLCGCLNIYSQATSLTIDNQTPGWLSSKIEYKDQLTVESLTITGYVNKTDLKFVGTLIKQKLKTIDLENVTYVSSNTLPENMFGLDNKDDYIIKKLAFPLSVTGANNSLRYISSIDTIIIGSPTFHIISKGIIDDGCNTCVNHWILREGVDSIADYSFGQYDSVYGWLSNENQMKSIEIPSTLRFIGRQAFAHCTFLENIVLPDSLKEIGYQAFYGTKIERDTLFLPAGLERFSISAYDIKSKVYYFSEKIKYIDNVLVVWAGNSAGFRGDNIINQGYGNSAEIHLKCVTPPGFNNTHYETLKNSTIYVPKGTYSLYQQTSPWDKATIIEEIYVEGISIENSKDFYVGDEIRLSAQIIPNDATDQMVSWKSSNPEVASISENGYLKALSCGTTTITVTTKDGGFKATCNVCVYNHTVGVDIIDKITIPIDKTYTLNACTLPLSTSDGKVTWRSDNSAIASVNDKGVVVAHKRGTCTITATSVDGGYTAKCVVTVTQPVEALALEKHSVSLKVGELAHLFAQITPATANDKTITWSSSDEQLATVDDKGIVTALKSGEVWIKAISQDNAEAKDSCIVTVIQPVIGIQLDNKTYQLNGIGDSFKLNATIIPDDASNKNIKWSSSNESICVVSHGLVVSVGYGTCVIVANTEDGGYIATCVVTNYPLGDVNRDGIVNISDVISVVNHILGQTPSGFLIRAADVNRDGKVDIVDATCIIDILLNSTLN